MVSKGIDAFSYIAANLANYKVLFKVPHDELTHTTADNFQSHHLEIESKDIEGFANFVGRFTFAVEDPDGQQIFERWVEVHTFTGQIKATSEDMSSQKQGSVVVGDVIISYLFYQAGHGEVGLTNHNQCHVTLISKSLHSTWMSTVVPSGSEAEQKPFSRFVLAAPHDDGMNSMITCEAVLEDRDEALVEILAKHIPALGWVAEHVSHSVISKSLPNIIYGLAITQKDPIPMLLDIGARYFEFRPAHLLPEFENKSSKVPSRHYFQHACIPGLALEEFLDEIVTFLDEHPLEHVVVHIRWDNIVSACKKPTPEELDEAFNLAVSKAKNTPITWGEASCFKDSIASLRADGRRIIRIIEAEKYDSWTAKAYATVHADPILAQFESMHADGQDGSDITVLQCQATSQSIKEVFVHCVLRANGDNSSLTSTKADLDRHTLPWIRDNALKNLTAERLLVVMNDFLEGATTDVVIELNKQRFAAP